MPCVKNRPYKNQKRYFLPTLFIKKLKNDVHSRIKINQLLEEGGWSLSDNEKGKAIILLENHVKISQKETGAWRNDYEKTKNGSLDFLEGMLFERELFKRFEDRIIMNDIINKSVELGNWEHVINHIQQEIFDRPEEYFNLEQLRKAAKIDRKVSIRELVPVYFNDSVPHEKFAA